MAITLLGQATPSFLGVAAPVGPTRAWSTGVVIPQYSLITAFGFISGTGANTLVSIVDSKSNSWTTRYALPAGGSGVTMYLADCIVQNALTATDTFTIDVGGSSGSAGWGGSFAYWNGHHLAAYFDKVVAGGPWNSTSTPPGAIAAATGTNSLILGLFGITTGNSTPSITTPGTGYTNQPGAGQYMAPDQRGAGFDWESKIVVGAAASEQPGATFNAVHTSIYGLTAIYRDAGYVFGGRNRVLV